MSRLSSNLDKLDAFITTIAKNLVAMANNYGYNAGGYSTTSYGAQGGADGGGFLGGSQGGSQDSPGGSKTYGKDTLRPVTIKQIIDAEQPHPDAEFRLDGHEMTQITFVGQIRTISTQATNITYKLDDGTDLIEVKQWIDSDAPAETAKSSLQENTYVRVYGRLKPFNNKRHVGAHVVRPITDFNEINMHLLEATYVHLYFTRGPPESLQGAAGGGGNPMFVEAGGFGGAANGAASGGGKPLPHMTATARRVFNLLQSAPQNNEGLHVQNIAAQLGLPTNDVFKAGDELLGLGIIYTTVDDETWAVLEF